VIGGVITSTILTLLVIPTFYEILTEWRDWIGERAGGLFGARGRRHAEPRVAGDLANGRTG